ncbi:MAG: hypothetical protein M1358_22815, partial [Chloroflexi bacterium]|nr:hypothetical protein [Chloroflexota bacterium]
MKDPSASEQWAGQYNLHVAVGSKKQADSLREAWKSQYLHNGQAPGETLASQEWQTKLWLCPSPETLPALSSLPVYSFVVHFRFTLQKPYLSRDDNDWHIIDNPLVRDKVFRWPMVRPSGWKGGLLSALWQLGYQQDDGQIQRIFGETRDDDAGRAGRLHLYPTFFNQSGLEIINPHDRERRVGKNPILLESVPIGATGAFTVLYVPFDRIGEEAQETRREVAKDLKLIAEGIGAMMTTYGFGAKASSGFGLAADALREGCLQVAGLDAAEEARQGAPVAQPQRNLPRYLSASGKLHPDFRAAHGVLISEAEYRQKIERRGQKYAKKDKQLYDKAKAWWEREGKALLEQVAPQPEPTMVQPPSRSP